MKEFDKVLLDNKTLVWREIKKYLKDPVYPEAFKIAPKYAADCAIHWKIVRDYPERQGKYLRPLLVLLTARAMGARRETAVKTAAAMQVSEDWILNHDDFEDDSLFRRGKPTLHRLYGPQLAVNAGDTLQVIMWKILFDNFKLLGENKAALIIEEFYTMLMRTTLGQSTEINWTQSNKTDYSDADWFFIADSKTCYYTIAGPMRLGAIIAGARKKQLDALAKFGTHLGRSFQLIDDILDLTSDFCGLKKQIGNDIYESKRTVLVSHLLRVITEEDRKKATKILQKSRKDKTAEEVKWVIAKMQEYNSISYAKDIACSEGQKAKVLFEQELGFLSEKHSRKNLSLLIDFILQRKY